MRKRTVLFTAAMLTSHTAIACSLHDARNDKTYKLNLTEKECKTINYMEGNTISIRLSLLEGAAIDYRREPDQIDLRLVFIEGHYDLSANINEIYFSREDGGLKVYNTPHETKWTFIGQGAELVIVKKRGRTWLAERMINGAIVNYQYETRYTDPKKMDDFVYTYVKKIMDQKEK
ncbi:hypothetical protein [Pseudomonas sp.]|uniref:hypothetical protein n=1 Tax=Pseudomonas sp. TaxID=306 RepID=UPI0028A81CF4|nr:hypothetical protein [Pseudomonas sp.]